MNGLKTLIFGSQLIAVGMFLGWRNETSVFISDSINDFRLGIFLIVAGLVFSFVSLRKTD
ncbi:hypothetical protein B1R32_11214 [Abditibacterium utsteinense]|uniref:Uncharacterized protein n=1 Tax=Abditibacterium utsteinense TaxID=1960156 RepID=A0A2S8SRI4_9BACT|nr:hypothetical protein [Abditibacterium utsteinense]PQV63359.1 hypothetical protein B1R32_11214 [Abditibacterium utsteinense]